ncbi:uncharacterized protein LOC125945730 [Dermacentor silvarum]|uniref:uncharacterized protein LOC125945730 n=1 Tax=Dermacentor silvarum TaxID=543639 RepID=UPI002100B5BD|nr:uncharacterized protein LOC125945730 [Dermacentor silvarum]
MCSVKIRARLGCNLALLIDRQFTQRRNKEMQAGHGAISPDKPLPDESGYWDLPPTPRNPFPYRIVYTEKTRPLRPSDFADNSSANSLRGEKSSSSEGTLTDTDDDSSAAVTRPLLSAYAWITVLSAASAACLFALMLVLVVSHRTMKAPTPTPEEPAVFIDPVEFVAKGGPDLLTDDGAGTVADTTTNAQPGTELAQHAGDYRTIATEKRRPR